MKKLLATLAASAVAVSMFAFAGCGDTKDNSPSGVIPGNYEQKDPEEMGNILNNFFNGEDGKGESNNEDDKTDKTTANMGLKIDVSGSMYAENYMEYNASIKADIKENNTDKGTIGAGTATVKANGKMVGMNPNNPLTMSDVVNVDVSGTAYMDGNFLYAGADGSFGAITDGKFESTTIPATTKVKINLDTIEEILETIVGGTDSKAPDQGTNPLADDVAGSDIFSMAALLQKANEYGVKVGVDVSNGMKLKISADANTVWTTATKVLIEEQGMSKEDAEQMVTAVKGYVTMNKFAVDIYVAFDSSKEVTGASVVMDIDVTVNMGIMTIIQGAIPTAEDEMPYPDMIVKISGSIEMYSHNETVTIPENIATDMTYIDRTQEFIDMLEDMASEIM